MEPQSPIKNSLLEYLDEMPAMGDSLNPATVLRQGQVAQEWLLTSYLTAWLELIGGLVDCEYPLAIAHASQFLALKRLVQEVDPALSPTDQVFFLECMQSLIKLGAKSTGAPSERSMQWGIWARDVVIAIADGFLESEILNPLVCESIAPCCMYAALLVSQVVTDEGVAEEIAAKMFEGMPRALLEIIRQLPTAPEA